MTWSVEARARQVIFADQPIADEVRPIGRAQAATVAEKLQFDASGTVCHTL